MNNPKEDVIKVFDSLAATQSWERLYSGAPDRLNYNFKTRQRAVEEILGLHAAGRALDIGCGSGDLLLFYAKKGIPYTGIDLSEAMIKRARANFATLVNEGKADFRVADCEQLPFSDGEFDVVSSVAVIEYVPDPSKALDELVRVTKKGGYILLTVPHKNCINKRIRSCLYPIRAVLFPVYVRVKKASLASMRDVVHYDYTQKEADRLMEERGTRKITHRYANFHIVPHPLDHLMPKLYMKLSDEVVRRKRGDVLKNWASNYIALYRK